MNVSCPSSAHTKGSDCAHLSTNSTTSKRSEISPLQPETPKKKRPLSMQTSQPLLDDILVSIQTDAVGKKAFRATPLPVQGLLDSMPIDLTSPADSDSWSVPSASISPGQLACSDHLSPLQLSASSPTHVHFGASAFTQTDGLATRGPCLLLERFQNVLPKNTELAGTATMTSTLTDNHVENLMTLDTGYTGKDCELIDVYGGQKRNKFKADRIIDVDDIPYYPESSSSSKPHTGVLYVINMARMSAEQRKAMHTHIAYSHTETGSSNESSVKYADAGVMRIRRFHCNGVKLCSGLHQAITHEHIGGALAEEVLKHNAALSKHFAGLDAPQLPENFQYGPLQARLNPEQMTYAVGQHIERRILLGGFCHYIDSSTGKKCAGLPRLRHVSDKRLPPETDALGHSVQPMTWLLGCSEWKAYGDNTHFTMWNLETKVNIEKFQDLLTRLIKKAASANKAEIDQEPKYRCSTVLHHSSRKVRCEELHGSARCQYFSSSEKFGACPVTFALMMPIEGKTADQERAYLFVSGGYHNHAPPPPDRLPKDILLHIKDTITRMEPGSLLHLTPLQILLRPEFDSLLRQYKVASIDEIHPSVKVDLLTGLIGRQRLLAAPDGRSFKAVTAQFRRELTMLPEDRYVRCAAEVSGHTFVVCFTDESVAALYASEYFEADLAFKRVKGEMREMEIITFSQVESRAVTHARIFMNSETKEAYCIAFRLLFQSIAEALDRPVLTFHHLNPESNLYAVISDFDTKQSAGLGLYLQTTDTEARSWNWQVAQCVRYCKVHYYRGIDKNFRTHPARSTMQALLRCTSIQAYLELLAGIETKWPETAAWARHKRMQHISCGLISAASGIPQNVWHRLPDNTNVSESAHHASNAGGIRLALLHAIEISKKLDQRSNHRSKAFNNTGTKATQRSRSTITQLVNAAYQQSRRAKLRKTEDMAGDVTIESPKALSLLSGIKSDQDCVVITDPNTPTKPMQGVNSSGAVKKGRGRPRGSKNKLTGMQRTTHTAAVLEQTNFSADIDTNAGVARSQDICKAEATIIMQQPQTATKSSASIFDQLCLSREQSAKLEQMPPAVKQLYMSQSDLLISEIEKEGLNSHPGVIKLRERYPVRTFSQVSEQVEIGGQLLEQFMRLWQVSIQQRRNLLL